MTRLRYADRALDRSVAAFREFRPGEEEARRLAIAALASKPWGGMLVYRVSCDGDFGGGPHDQWIPEYILWSLIDVTRYRCPYHR